MWDVTCKMKIVRLSIYVHFIVNCQGCLQLALKPQASWQVHWAPELAWHHLSSLATRRSIFQNNGPSGLGEFKSEPVSTLLFTAREELRTSLRMKLKALDLGCSGPPLPSDLMCPPHVLLSSHVTSSCSCNKPSIISPASSPARYSPAQGLMWLIPLPSSLSSDDGSPWPQLLWPICLNTPALFFFTFFFTVLITCGAMCVADTWVHACACTHTHTHTHTHTCFLCLSVPQTSSARSEFAFISALSQEPRTVPAFCGSLILFPWL